MHFSRCGTEGKEKEAGQYCSCGQRQTAKFHDRRAADRLHALGPAGAWQLGDIEKLHKDYADDVSIVNGSWAPPILGWTNYLAVYQQQRARMQQVRMDRTNTYIKVSGTVAWACYQWDFAGVVDGQQTESQGQTSLVLEKRNGRWIVVHNHTSLAARPPQPAPANAPSGGPAPAKPAPR